MASLSYLFLREVTPSETVAIKRCSMANRDTLNCFCGG